MHAIRVAHWISIVDRMIPAANSRQRMTLKADWATI